VKGRRLLSMNGDAETANLFLDRRKNRYYRCQGLLVLRHDATDVLDVLAGVVLLPGAGLNVLKPDVEQLQGSLYGVDLRKRDELNG